jgi:hypothetical protein
MQFDRRRGFRRGDLVHFSEDGVCGRGSVTALYHATAAVETFDGRTLVVRYRDMTRI